ncbi:conjugal transfer protein TraD [Labrys neptuniae]|uniref:Conjugal transfer protein TraD n=1 Tax=Labrys neptuniae TaxID=376174 RepID=A0ABV3PWC4_9HYPH
MRSSQVERRRRTRHLIELGGLIVKAGIVELTGDDRAIVYGALLWMADKLKSDQNEQARTLWSAKGEQAFNASSATSEQPNAPHSTSHSTRSQIEIL